MLRQCACMLCYSVSPSWINSSPISSNELCVMTLVDEYSRIPEIQKSLRVHNNFTWEITVNGHILKSDNAIFSSLSQSIDSLSSFSKVLSFVNECDICAGNNDVSFQIFHTTNENNFVDSFGECAFDYV